MEAAKIVGTLSQQALDTHVRLREIDRDLLVWLRGNEVARRLTTIPGTSISPLDVPVGCAFAPRCEYRMDVCEQRPLMHGDGSHQDACWLTDEQRVAIRTKATAQEANS